MWEFIKNVFRSTTRVLLGFFFLFVFGLIIVGVLSLFSSDKIERGVLKITLNKELVELNYDNPFEDLDLPISIGEGSNGVINTIQAIENATVNDDIKGIMLNLGSISGGYAQVEEIRSALQAFKQSKKPVYAYGEYMTEKAYYLASVADKIYLPNEGILEFNGLYTELMFFKGVFEKLGVEPKVFKVGKFKSAVEPFIRKDMSDANRLQVRTYLESIYGTVLSKISKSRGVSKEELRRISDELLVQTPDDAKKHKLIDGVAYYDEVITKLKAQLDIDLEDKITFISPSKLVPKVEMPSVNNKIAVVVAEGEIIDGSSSDGYLGSRTFVKNLNKAVDDKSVKAIVIRINSPGGSALASDIMWRAIKVASSKKPTIASMSSVAASGGYYMAMACDTIVAEPHTITGSIGVFGLLVELDELLENKIGITTDRERTGRFADIGMPTRKFTAEDSAIIQQNVERTYQIFISKVAEGRDMTVAAVYEVASGRVWTGQDAQKIGLVDEIGGLKKAVRIATESAKMKDYDVTYYPKEKGFLGFASNGSNAKALLRNELPKEAQYALKVAERLSKTNGVQTRMAFDIKIK